MTYKRRFTNKTGISSPISGINSNAGAWNGSPGQNGSQTGGWSNPDFGYKNYQSNTIVSHFYDLVFHSFVLIY